MISDFVAAAIHFACGARANRLIPPTPDAPVVYFANHTSHLDFPVIWAALDSRERARVRPVAAVDYWGRGSVRPFLAQRLFHAILIERGRVNRRNNPITALVSAVRDGSSLIIFPEGTRSADGRMLPFKSGLWYLRKALPGTPFVPLYLDNLVRILPKGEVLAVPMLCSVAFGAPLSIVDGERRNEFLLRAKLAVEALRPS
jgi:1-acyl-sn-glycerol-3-phosphate acyltransferase